jgi:hypothetical protein
VVIPALVLGHVPIGQYNLQVPLAVVLIAAMAAVAASFLLIYLAPPKARAEEETGPALPGLVPWSLTAVGVVYLGFILYVGLFGRQTTAVLNGAAILFWIWTVPVLPLLHCFVGGMYEVGNPFMRAATLLSGGRSLANAEAILARLGYWPAVIELLVLIWTESIAEAVQSPAFLGLATLAYIGLQVGMGALLGPGWFRGGDLFHVITSLAGTIAPVALRRDAAGVVRLVRGFHPGRFLPPARGREALITLWLAGVLADGVRATPPWKAFYAASQQTRESMGQLGPLDGGEVIYLTIEIMVTWAIFAAFFWAFAYLPAPR